MSTRRGYKVVQLEARQLPWANKAKNILTKYHGYIDASRTGAGKSRIPLWLAQLYDISLLIIAPGAVIPTWQKLCAEFGIKTIDIMTYGALVSKLDCDPKHGLLEREDVVIGKTTDVIFTPTAKYLKYVEKGILVVIDEAHFCKNESTGRRKAVEALLKPIVSSVSNSRYAMLSATLYCKQSHAINLLRTMGIITSDSLHPDASGFTETGLAQLREYFGSMDKEKTEELLSTQTDYDCLLHDLFVTVARPVISGSMPIPMNVEYDTANGLYNVTNKDKLTEVTSALAKKLEFNDNTGVIGKKVKRSNITNELRSIEILKVPDFTRIVKAGLTKHNSCKYIVFLTYIQAIQQLAEELSEYNPILFYGNTAKSLNSKKDLIAKFKYDKQCRVIIANPVMAAFGIDLDDTIGNEPRITLISPTFRAIEVVQAAGRARRATTKSKAVVRIVYSNINQRLEMRMTEAMDSKSVVLKELLSDEDRLTTLMPGEWPLLVEGKDNNL